jgi:IMP cyclohydrolase
MPVHPEGEKMKENLYKYLSGNEYPGRGICIGKTKSGKLALIAYFIMGRSVNSRNRVFDPIDGGIRTLAANPSKMTDPHLIIYNPVLTLEDTTIVTNGDQTDTIRNFIAGSDYPGFGFEAALNTRTFEDDEPNWTPRISGVVNMRLGGYKLSILKSAGGNEKSVQRFVFDYPQPLPGEGHFISTYQCNGSPIPSFEGEPLSVAMDAEDPEKFAAKLWKALNKDNKVSLFVRAIQLSNQTYQDIIINKYKRVEENQE